MSALKLYVWEDCFRDWSAGLGVAIAEDSDEARRLLVEKIGYTHDDLAHPPAVYELTERVAFFVHGGS